MRSIKEVKEVMQLSEKILNIVDTDAPRGDIQGMAEALAMDILRGKKELLAVCRMASLYVDGNIRADIEKAIANAEARQ